ncbi:cupin domain-containing protein [Ponticoccus sp. SC2-23]|uniref:(R)-mandelonitrile lyase n=1 Tax=Alexandriicola marinus TaxID=2081710 RepID=UPI000FD8AF49|nr:cupin domain-containing protein [Alexandriicola marinus]MBM1221876.1 cupin domain-containing protein [Ponticoccus sp. SC6-9]MBM1226227.1 cupin domain-containing protein [Ponticoccus sp. SC6-15]MBM1230823.1 cupin domain-containing protein [Ponticoccus sp. SC6-38]MBM1235336.1 cupin domain-containing protein [Ponticoccus sp. SC6-45]MBM1239845.1 cupin domain-containing protein [Ponticoccus sp. SC6-49]MBM1243989.1 cupin domain-containing protein [Ponticoccus sp. SC2-64]MBM1248860.1 cupin domai
MKITRANEIAAKDGPADWFTGAVRFETLHSNEEPSRANAVRVTFQPRARTAWHTHPLGQTLIVLSGAGLVQRDGGPVEDIAAGDVVWFPPGERHWHGAGPDGPMCHIAIQEALEGSTTTWLEHVSDADYGR